MDELSAEQKHKISTTAAATAAAVADAALVLNQLADQTNQSLEDVEVPRHHHHHQSANETILIEPHSESICHQSRKRSRSRSSSSSSSGSRGHHRHHNHHHEKHHQYCPENMVFNIFQSEVAVRSQTLPDQELLNSRALEEQAPVLHSTPETQETETLAVQVPINDDDDQAAQTSTNGQSLDQDDTADLNENAEPIIEGTIADDHQLAEILEENPPAQISQPLNHSQLQIGLENYRRKKADIKAARKKQGLKLAEKARERRGQPFKRVSKSQKAGLVFSVTKVLADLKNLEPGRRVTEGAAVYLASVLEYLSAEVLELSGGEAEADRRSRITPRHLQLSIHKDAEIFELLKDVTIRQGGVVPHIQPILLDTKKNINKIMPKDPRRVQASQKAVATRKKRAEQGKAPKRASRPAEKTESETELSDAESVHETRVQAGKKAAETRKRHVKEQGLEDEEHEKHVKAGYKAAITRKSHAMGEEPDESELERIDEQSLSKLEKSRSTPSKRKREDESPEERELTTHEKLSRAGKKGAEVRKQHMKEQERKKKQRRHTEEEEEEEEEETEQPSTQESVASTKHARRVEGGKKAAETRRRHEKEAREAKKSTGRKQKGSRSQEDEEDDDDDEEDESEEQQHPSKSRKTRYGRRQSMDEYDFGKQQPSSSKALKRSQSTDNTSTPRKHAKQGAKSSMKQRRSMSDTDLSELDTDIRKKKMEKRLLEEECQQLMTQKTHLVHELGMLEEPNKPARKPSKSQRMKQSTMKRTETIRAKKEALQRQQQQSDIATTDTEQLQSGAEGEEAQEPQAQPEAGSIEAAQPPPNQLLVMTVQKHAAVHQEPAAIQQHEA